MMHRDAVTGPRKGLSLLEVLVALAIFLFALVGIGRLVTLGSDRALDVQLQSEAAQLAQSKLAEVVAGVVSLSSQSDVPFDEDSDWHWSLDCEQGNVPNLWTVTVTVNRVQRDGSRLENSLHAMVLDPSVRGSTADAANSASSNSSSTADSSNTGSASSSGSSPTPTAGGASSSTSRSSTSASPSSSGAARGTTTTGGGTSSGTSRGSTSSGSSTGSTSGGTSRGGSTSTSGSSRATSTSGSGTSRTTTTGGNR